MPLFLFTQAPKLGLRSKVHATAQKFQSDHWQSVVKIIDDYMKMLKANFVSFIKYAKYSSSFI